MVHVQLSWLKSKGIVTLGLIKPMGYSQLMKEDVGFPFHLL